MSIPTPHQLILVRQLYEDAFNLAAREDDLSLTKALILLDLSVEQMLNQLLRDFDRDFAPNFDSGRRDVGWRQLWQLAQPVMKDMGSRLVNYRELSSLHEIRNLAQHNGSIPAQGEVKRYIQPVSEMMRTVFRDAYNQDFDTFTLWELIPNEGLRQWLQDSEFALKKGRVTVCIAGCNVAHGLIISAIRTNTKLRRFQISLSNVLPRSPGGYHAVPSGLLGLASQLRQAANQIDNAIRQGVEHFRKEILREMEFLEDEVVTIGVGLPLMDTRRFQKIGNHALVFLAESGDIQIRTKTLGTEQSELLEGARFMLTYLSRLVRLVDEAYPEVLAGVRVKKRLREQGIWKDVEPANEAQELHASMSA
jgi:hypothetical protein